jgi:hypothetical protein
LTLCPYFITTLLSISKRPDILALIDNETYQDVIVETIETLVLFIGEQEFFTILEPTYKDVVVHICFNLLRTSPAEL